MLNILAQLWYKILFVWLMFLSVSLFLVSRNPQGDLLAYAFATPSRIFMLMLYDPQHHKSIPILTRADFLAFDFSVDGRIAFSLASEGNAELYVLDTHSLNTPPINISDNPATKISPLAWSPDGRYLAFESQMDRQERSIYVWDGEKSINITPNNMDGIARQYVISWSRDRRLAFATWYDDGSADTVSEIYLWDGKTVSNLSQNPDGGDFSPIWSTDGRLAFVSQHNNTQDIFVWDGVSIKNGSPDANSFVNVSPELTISHSSPTWTARGMLAFKVSPSLDNLDPIYVWDGQRSIRIIQDPTLYIDEARWSSDGISEFLTLFSSKQYAYVRYAGNPTLQVVANQYAPAWSSDGQTVFCRDGLYIWNEREIIRIAKGQLLGAQWQSGSKVNCSVP